MDDLCPDPTEMGVLENRLSVDALEYRIDILERKVRRQARLIDALLKQSFKTTGRVIFTDKSLDLVHKSFYSIEIA